MTTSQRGSLHDDDAVQIQWRTRDGKEHEGVAERARLSDELYLAAPIRTSHQYPKRRHYSGENWFANTGTHTWHESLFERQALLWLDFRHDIVAIAAQPMRMDFGNGLHHFPDFIALHSDLRQVVYDIKPVELFTPSVDAQFESTRLVCETVGWGYEILSAFEPTTQANLAWLSNFRQNHYAPPPEARLQLLATLTSALTLQDAADSIQVGPINAHKGWIYHLAWVGEVLLDLSQPLSNTTLVRKAA